MLSCLRHQTLEQEIWVQNLMPVRSIVTNVVIDGCSEIKRTTIALSSMYSSRCKGVFIEQGTKAG